MLTLAGCYLVPIIGNSVLSSLRSSLSLVIQLRITQFACINREKQWPDARALRYTEVQIQTLI